MRRTHLITESETFGKCLKDHFETCREAFIATAFFTTAAFRNIEKTLRSALNRRARLTFLLGRYDYVTQPDAVTGLLRLAKISEANLHVFFDGYFEFHYKLALFRDAARFVAIIGSSNVTPKGLSSRGEINVEIIDEKGLYNQLRKDLLSRLETALPAEEELIEYSHLYQKYRRLRNSLDRANSDGAKKSNKHGLQLGSILPGKNDSRLPPADSRQLNDSLGNVATVTTVSIQTDAGILKFPERPAMFRPILDLLHVNPLSSRTIEHKLAERFRISKGMREAVLRSGNPAWRNHVSFALKDLGPNAGRGKNQIERIADRRAPEGGTMGIYRLATRKPGP